MTDVADDAVFDTTTLRVTHPTAETRPQRSRRRRRREVDLHTATPTRDLVHVTPRIAATASVTGTVGALCAAQLAPVAALPVAAAVAAASVLTVGGRTVWQWAGLRLAARSAEPEQAALFSRDSVGIVTDGRSVTAFVQIGARPWQVTRIDARGVSDGPTVPTDALREQLGRLDIPVSKITVVCSGYKFAARDGGASALDTLIGPVSAPLGGTTVVAVTLELDGPMMVPAYARARRGSLPDGLCQALTVATRRVQYSLAEYGLTGTVLTSPQVRALHDAALVQLVNPLAKPGWRSCGDRRRDGAISRTFVPARGHWNARSSGGWHHLQSHRQYTSVTLTPTGADTALAQPVITYVTGRGEQLAKAGSYGLRPASGQQIPGLLRALPVAVPGDLRTPGAVIGPNRRLGFDVPACGGGVFLGVQPDKTRVFMAVRAATDPLWITGPELLALQLVARLSTQDTVVAVMIDSPRWRALIDHRATPALVYGDAAVADVVVCTPQWWERNRSETDGKAVVLVDPDSEPRSGARNTVVVERGADGSASLRIHADEQDVTVGWELTPLERRELLGPAGTEDSLTGSPSAPRAGADPDLGEVVSLPVAVPAAPATTPRTLAPAPQIHALPVVDTPVPDPVPADPVTVDPVPEPDQVPVEPDPVPAETDQVPAETNQVPDLGSAAESVTGLGDWPTDVPPWVPDTDPAPAADERPTTVIPAITEQDAAEEPTGRGRHHLNESED